MARLSQWLRIFLGAAMAVQVMLGLYVWWTGNQAWLPVHLLLGLLIIGGIWLATLVASRAQVGFARSIATVALTLVLPLFGMAQMFVPSGAGHWVLVVLHVGAAGSAIGMANRLALQAQDRFTAADGAVSTPSGSLGHARV